MPDYIFATEQVAKKDFYNWLLNKMIGAGWRNISSNPTSDGDVLQSIGEDGTRNLILNLRPGNTTGNTGQGSNPITTTDYNVMSYRLLNDYTPGTAGTSGTSSRALASTAWETFYVIPTTTTIPKDTILTVRYHVNKNRIILLIETPAAVGVSPILYYIGLPDEFYCSEPNSRGLLIGSTGYNKYSGAVHISDTVGELASIGTTAGTSNTTYQTLAPKNPNSAGKYIISDIFYGDSTIGFRGKLTGLFALPNQNVLNGDIIKIDTKQYYVAVCQSANNNAFGTLALAIQIA
ncbi:hypothetical protein GFC29_3817 (plasmid) [Anoxybacillus sp. B7M1]|uniref:hypothetical protein n=1 Tax=Anoxybacillus sp. B7M1 TaxID=1490057 RepID=UPI0005CCF7EF|nr:hypothetical protein [Anoxybacillus sp. B7M1]ANB66142.1 hypothetical protein GFC29_3817 [Anoxybacillus sp. B7M1]